VLRSIAIGSILVCVTIVVHAVGSMAWVHFIMKRYAQRDGDWRVRDTIPVLVSTGLVLMMLHVAEVALWAVTYRALPAITELETLEKAVYFSMVTFTTLGYGEITLGPDWRVLSSIEAMNGILLIGWTTALLFSVLQRTWILSHRPASRSSK
jgi:voltage-gated potassium channel